MFTRGQGAGPSEVAAEGFYQISDGQVEAKFTLADITKGQLTSQANACERGRRAEQKDGETKHHCRADEEVWRR